MSNKLDLFMAEIKAYDYKWFDEIGGNDALQEIEELRKQKGCKNDIAQVFEKS